MRAMTEIPANMPRPIGRTESFFPETEKGSAVEVACSGVESLLEWSGTPTFLAGARGEDEAASDAVSVGLLGGPTVVKSSAGSAVASVAVATGVGRGVASRVKVMVVRLRDESTDDEGAEVGPPSATSIGSRVQFLTTRTACPPSTGVSEIMHDSIIGPIDVSLVRLVWTVTGPVSSPSARRIIESASTCGEGKALEIPARRTK